MAEPANCDLLLSTCFTVWLKTSPQQPIARVAAQGDQRPMAGNREVMDDLRRILTGREALYAQADAIVDTAVRSIEQSLNTLARVLQADQPPERTP